MALNLSIFAIFGVAAGIAFRNVFSLRRGLRDPVRSDVFVNCGLALLVDLLEAAFVGLIDELDETAN